MPQYVTAKMAVTLESPKVLNLIGYFDKILCTIAKTRLFKYIEKIHLQKLKFQIKTLIFFLISVQNIDCGYSLEPPRRAEIRSIIYTPVNPILLYKSGV